MSTTACATFFVRPGELRHAEWIEFDIEKAEWRIPAEKMKKRCQLPCKTPI
jgi:integrase